MTKPQDLPDAAYLRSWLIYNPETGAILWRRARGHVKAGNNAGGRHRGTIRIKLDRKSLLAHRVAWKMQTGVEPPAEIDHKDGDGTNMRWNNLRAATRPQNTKNRRLNRNNPHGLKGVTQDKRRKKPRFAAQIIADGCRHHLGTFDTKEEAHAAYIAAAKRLHGEFYKAA